MPIETLAVLQCIFYQLSAKSRLLKDLQPDPERIRDVKQTAVDRLYPEQLTELMQLAAPKPKGGDAQEPQGRWTHASLHAQGSKGSTPRPLPPAQP